MKDALLTIQQAAKLLGVSTKTLRRWEDKGVLKPQRTHGNQRRYTLAEIQDLKLTNTTPSSAHSANPVMNLPVDLPINKPANVGLVPSLNEPSIRSIEGATISTQVHTPAFRTVNPLHLLKGASFLLGLIAFGITGSILLGSGYIPKFTFYDRLKEIALTQKDSVDSNFGEVLADITSQKYKNSRISFNLPTIFNSPVTVNSDTLLNGNATVSGQLTAPNILYSITAGQNVSITGDAQNPIISTELNGVTSLAGQTGELNLTGGTGISVSGLSISNTGVTSLLAGSGITLSGSTGGITVSSNATSSTEDTFRNIQIGADTITASGTNDTLELVAGSGISITPNTTNKTITIDSTGGGSGITTVEEGDTAVTNAAAILDFLDGDFDVGESPAGEANVQLSSILTSVTGVAGNFDIAGALTSGTGNAFSVSSTGGITIPSGQTLTVGTIGLDSAGVSNVTSGASLIGVFDEFTNSASTNLQAVLSDFDSAIGGGSSKWTTLGTLTYLSTTANSVTVGSSTELAKLAIDGDADEIQLLIQGNATQTNPLAVFENSAGVDQFTIANNGNAVAAGSLTSTTLDTGQGANELYDMNQDVLTTSSVTFDTLTLTNDLSVANGGTGAGTFATNGVLYGNSTGAIQVTSAGTGGQVLLANGSGVPTFTTIGTDATISSTGALTIAANAVALGTDTTGDYVASFTAGGGLTGDSSGEGSTPTLAVGAGNGITVNADDVAIRLDTTAADGSTTSSVSGLEFAGGELTLLRGCANGELLKWNNTNFEWGCATDTGGLSSAVVDVREGNTPVGTNVTVLNFDANDFAITESPSGQDNIAIDYTNSFIARKNQNETVTGNWTFSSATPIALSSTSPVISIGNTGTLSITDGTNTLCSIADGGTTGNLSCTGTISATGALSASTLDTGQGANELYDMNQDVLTTSSVTFDTLTLTNDLSVANGGTGAGTFTQGGVLYGNAGSAIGASAQGTAGQALVSGGTGSPTWTTGTLTLAGSFATSGANSLTLTTTGVTNVTLPTTGTLATIAGTETLTNKTLTDNVTFFQDQLDNTKKLQFDIANVGTGATLTLGIPTAPGTTDTICLLTKANCVGAGGGAAIGGSGTLNRIAKFTPDGNNIGDSGISDASDAIAITIDSSEKVGIGDTTPLYLLTVGGADAFGVNNSGELTWEGATANAFELTLTPGDVGQDSTITLPDPLAATDTICLLTLANCSGAGSGNTLQAAYNAGNTITTTTGRDIALTLASGLGTATKLSLTNNHVSNATDFYLNNANASGTNTNGILVEQTGAGTLTNGFNITQTAGAITNGLTFSGTFTKLINSANFNVTNAGAVTAVGVDSGGGAITGSGGLTLTGTTLINNSGTANTTIGNSSGGTITIGASSGSDLALNDAQWSVTGAGAANFVSIGAATPGTGAFTTLSSNGVTTLGNNSATVAIDSSSWDVSSGGAISGLTGFTQASGVHSVTLTTTNAAQFASSTANSDTIRFLPQSSTATNAFNGIITSSDLTVSDKTWTFPNASGTVAVSATGPITLSALGDIGCASCLVTSGTLFTLDGDDADTETIAQGNTLLVAGGTNGIDTDVSATDTVTLNLDTTEIGTTTFGSNSDFTWTLNSSGGTDPTIAFGSNSITLGGSVTANTFASSGVTITGGTINSTSIGASTPSTGAFTTLTATGDVTMNDAGADNILIGAAADTLTLTSDTLSLTDDNWSISGAGAANFVSIGAATPGTGAFTTLSSNGVTTLGDGGDAITLDGSSLALQTTGAGSDITVNAVDQVILTDFTNGGLGCSALETNASGHLTCGSDDGGSGGTISAVGNVLAGSAFTGIDSSANKGNSLVFEGSTSTDDANDITLTAANPSASRIYTLPDLLTDGTFAFLEGAQTFSGAKTFSDLTISDTNISLSGASTTFTSTGAFTLTPGGAVTLGDGGDTLAIDSSVWDITGAGVASGLTGLSSSGTITFSGLTADRAVFTTTGGQLTTTGASANLASSLTDETGTGLAVFGTSPNITTSLTTGSSSFDLLNTTATTLNFAGAATALNIGASGGTTITPGGSWTIPQSNSKTLTITSDLSAGARNAIYPLVISQAASGANDNTVGLLQLSNSDAGSTAPLLQITQVAAGGGISFSGMTTGTTIDATLSQTAGTTINLRGSNLTTGRNIQIAGSLSTTLSNFSGNLILASPTRTNTATSGTVTDSGNFLTLTRANTQSGAGGTYAITGDVAALSSSLTETAGTITDSSNILSLAQNCGTNADCTGAVLDITNAGTGNGGDITLTNTLGTQTNGILLNRNGSGGTTTNAINITQTAGTLTNGINFAGGTLGTGITFDASDLTTEIVLENAETISNQTDGRITFGGADLVVGGDDLYDSGSNLRLTLGATTTITATNTTATGTLSVQGNSIGLNDDASANNVLSFGAGPGAPTGDLYWGSRLLCTAGSVNCGWATSATSPFIANTGIIDKADNTNRLRLQYGDAADTQLEIENTTNSIIPTADAAAINLTGGTTGIVTDGVDGLFIAAEFGNGTTNTNSGLHIDIDPVNTPSGDEIFYGINIDGLSAGTSATETAIKIGSNWDTVLDSANLDISGTGAITGATGYTQASGNFDHSASSGTFSTGTGAVSLNGDTTIAAGKNLALASGTGTFTQTYTGTGNALSVTSSSTTSVNKALNISQTGATSGTDYAGYFSNTGAGTTNVGLYATATGATNNYAGIFENGNVGIGTATPTEKLLVANGSIVQNFNSSYTLSITDTISNTDNAAIIGSQDIYVVDTLAYLISDSDDRITILDVSDTSNIRVISTLQNTTSLKNCKEIEVRGNYAYLVCATHATNGNRITVVDISNPNSPSVVGTLQDNTNFDDPKGIDVQGRYAYIVSEDNDGFSVIDISNPTLPRRVATITDSTNMDEAKGVDVQGDYAYVASRISDSLSVIDISNPSSPTRVGTVANSSTLNGANKVTVKGHYAYVSATIDDRMVIVDVSNPTTPVIEGSVQSTDLDGIQMVTVAGDYAYAAVDSANRITAINIADPANPSIITSLQDNTLLSNIQEVFVSGRRLFFAADGLGSTGHVGVISLPGISATSAFIGSINTTQLQVTQNATIQQNLSVQSGLNVGLGGAKIQGDFSVGNNALIVDTINTRAGIGDASPDAFLEILGTTEQLRLTHTDGTKDVRFTLDTNGDLTLDASTDGSGSETLSLTGFSTVSGSGALSLGSGSATNLSLLAGTSSQIQNVQIGVGGAGSTTPDFLGLDVKSDTGDPAGGFEGAIYYNTFDNKFRCYQGAGWTDCIGSGTITAVGNITSGAAFTSGTPGAELYFADNGFLGLGSGAGRIEFDDQTTDEVNILNALVGIGTSTPSYLLDLISSTGRGIRLSDSTANSTDKYARMLTRNYNTAEEDVLLIGSINSSGSNNIYIGGGGADNSLNAASNIIFGTASNSNTLDSSALERMRIDGSGNVGIGTTSPSSRLHVVGTNQSSAGASAAQTLNIAGGSGGNGTTTAGGAGSLLSMTGGAGGSGGVSSNNGLIGGAGGALTFTSGGGGTGGNGIAGVGTAGAGAAGGGITITSGAGGAGGDAAATSGNPNGDGGSGGNITIQTGAGGAAGVNDGCAGSCLTGTVGSYGNIVMQVNGGNVGIGTSTPTAAKLVVNGSIDATFATANTERLCWDGGGSSNITDCTGTPGDYAEEYGTSDSSIDAGDVVIIDPTRMAEEVIKDGEKGSKAWILKSTKAYQNNVLGIVSTNPNETIGQAFDPEDNPRPVALNGRVPVKVAFDSPAIEAGDYITTSAQLGRAMKATQAGQMIGKALEDWAPGSGKETAMVFVGTSYADPNSLLAGLYIDANGNLILPEITTPESDATALGGLPAPKKDLGWTLSNIISRLTRLEEKVNNSSPVIASTSASLSTSSSAAISTNEIASSSSTPRNDEEIASLNSKFLTLDSKVASIEAQLITYNLALITNTSSTSAELGLEQIDAKSGTISGTLSVGGRTTLSDIGITGKMNIGLLAIEGLSENGFATINTTSGPLKLQSDGFNGLDILNGKVIIATNGDIKTKGEITAKKVNIDIEEVAGASLGEAILEAGQQNVVVQTTALTDNSKIFVQAIDNPIATAVKKTGTDKFEIKIKTAQATDLKLNWWIVN